MAGRAENALRKSNDGMFSGRTILRAYIRSERSLRNVTRITSEPTQRKSPAKKIPKEGKRGGRNDSIGSRDIKDWIRDETTANLSPSEPSSVETCNGLSSEFDRFESDVDFSLSLNPYQHTVPQYRRGKMNERKGRKD